MQEKRKKQHGNLRQPVAKAGGSKEQGKTGRGTGIICIHGKTDTAVFHNTLGDTRSRREAAENKLHIPGRRDLGAPLSRRFGAWAWEG
jgi:hypothetical protein